MSDHLKGFFESAAYLHKQDRQWLDDFDKQTIAAYDHIRALRAFRDEVMGLLEVWKVIPCWRIEGLYAKHFPKEQEQGNE
jgi:hypothetical protein